MTALENQLSEELQANEKTTMKLITRLDTQEANFLNHLKEVTQGFKNELDKFEESNKKLLNNQELIWEKLQTIQDQLADFQELEINLKNYIEIQES